MSRIGGTAGLSAEGLVCLSNQSEASVPGVGAGVRSLMSGVGKASWKWELNVVDFGVSRLVESNGEEFVVEDGLGRCQFEGLRRISSAV
jgi:hypothetical protein